MPAFTIELRIDAPVPNVQQGQVVVTPSTLRWLPGEQGPQRVTVELLVNGVKAPAVSVTGVASDGFGFTVHTHATNGVLPVNVIEVTPNAGLAAGTVVHVTGEAK